MYPVGDGRLRVGSLVKYYDVLCISACSRSGEGDHLFVLVCVRLRDVLGSVGRGKFMAVRAMHLVNDEARDLVSLTIGDETYCELECDNE